MKMQPVNEPSIITPVENTVNPALKENISPEDYNN
jgi:hypothetical protein